MKLFKSTFRNLINKRVDDLKSISELPIRPLGKWHGLDVFSWQSPLSKQLESTILSFPYPVILVFNDYKFIEKCKRSFSFQALVGTTILVDNTILNGEDLDEFVVVPNLAALFEKLNGSIDKGIVLFLFFGNNQDEKVSDLMNYLKIEMTK